MKLTSILCIGLMTVFSSAGFAADRPTQDSQYRLIKDRVSAEYSLVHALRIDLQAYAQNHSNNLPNSWSELNTFVPLSDLGNPPIQDRYALVPNASPSDDLEGAQVLVIGVAPSSDAVANEQGRFIIYRTKNGEYLNRWYPEPKVQKIIAQTHIVVPPPPAITPSSNPPPSPPPAGNQVPASTAPQTQAISTEPSPAAPASPPQTPKPIAEVAPASDTGIPPWLYGIIVLSLGLIGSLWYFLKTRK